MLIEFGTELGIGTGFGSEIVRGKQTLTPPALALLRRRWRFVPRSVDLVVQLLLLQLERKLLLLLL